MDWGGDGGGRNYIGTGAEDPRGIPRRKVGGKVAARAGTAAYAAGENGESEWPRGAGAYSCPCARARARARASEASSTRGRGPVVAIPPAEAEPIGFAVSRQRLGGWWGRGRSLLGLGIRWQTGGPAAWRGVAWGGGCLAPPLGSPADPRAVHTRAPCSLLDSALLWPAAVPYGRHVRAFFNCCPVDG